MQTTIKRILFIFIAIFVVLFGSFIALRPWWLGNESVKAMGKLQDIRYIERPMCKYWQGDLKIEEPGRGPELYKVWVDPTQRDLIDKLEMYSKSGEKMEVQYQKARASRFWACTPSDFQLISIEPPIKYHEPKLPEVQAPTVAPSAPAKATPEPMPVPPAVKTPLPEPTPVKVPPAAEEKAPESPQT